MAYKRKTIDVFKLIYNGEEIDRFDSYNDASLALREYCLAFHCPKCFIYIKKGREVKS